MTIMLNDNAVVMRTWNEFLTLFPVLTSLCSYVQYVLHAPRGCFLPLYAERGKRTIVTSTRHLLHLQIWLTEQERLKASIFVQLHACFLCLQRCNRHIHGGHSSLNTLRVDCWQCPRRVRVLNPPRGRGD